MRSLKKGEIATVLTLGALIVLGVSSFIASTFLKNKQTTKTEAEEATSCQCKDGKPSSSTLCGDTNPCGPEGGSCSNYGDWKNDCTGSAENCPADAGVTYTYWCDGGKWRFQYPNCTTWCKPAYLTQAPTPQSGGPCDGKSAGEILQNQQPPSSRTDVLSGSRTEPKLDSSKYYSCDGNQGVWVNMNAFCDQFGQIQWGPGSKTDKACVPPDINVTKTPSSGGISIGANVYVSITDKGANFATETQITSSDCDGDLSLFVNGNRTAISGWNRADKGAAFTFPKDYGMVSVASGNSQNFTYMARLDNCPRSKVPLTDSVTCNFGVSPYGIPWVRGGGCNLKNFDEVQKITPLPTPKFQPRVTWAPPPTPKISVPPIIFRPGAGTACQPFQCPEGTQKYAESGGGAYIYTRLVGEKTKYFLNQANCNNASNQGKDSLEAFCGKVTPTPGPGGTTVPGGATSPPGATITPLPGQATAKCEDPSVAGSVNCPSSYNETDAAGNLRWVVRSCPNPDQQGKCQYTCFNSTKTEITPCWSDQGGQKITKGETGKILIVVLNSSNKVITVRKIEGFMTKLFGQGTEWITSNEKNAQINAGLMKTFTFSSVILNDGEIPASLTVRYTDDQDQESLKGPFNAKWGQVTIVQIPQ